MILQLADDLNVLALVAQRFPDSVNVSSLTDEGGEDHVDSLLQAEMQVLDVLFRQSREVDGSPWEVDTFLAAQHATILNLAHQIVAPLKHTSYRETFYYSAERDSQTIMEKKKS